MDQKRLEALIDSASKNALVKNTRTVTTTIEIAKEKTQYFEKIAIGSGATIAAIVSFVGAHSSRLQPSWLLRTTLIIWVVTMIGAMFRNWLYPYYVMASLGRSEFTAKRERDQYKESYIATYPSIGLEDGLPIDRAESAREFKAEDLEYKKAIEKFERNERINEKVLLTVEPATLALAVLGMAFLVFLAWKNF